MSSRCCADLRFIAPFLAAWLFCTSAAAQPAPETILRLKSGDRVSGVILREDATHLVLSNSWVGELQVPVDAIAHRERAATPPPPPPETAPLVQVITAPSAAPLTPPVSPWKGEAQVGLDLRYGARDRQIYHGRLKLGYHRPYDFDPALFFRNDASYTIEYGRTENTSAAPGEGKWITSSDRMELSDKIGWDIHQRWYIYNLALVGYDRARKVDLQYEAGPGIGFRLFTRTNFTMSLEAGWNYQAQQRSDSPDVEDFFYRIAEELTWKPGARTTLTQKLELFPRVNLNQLRMRAEMTLSYDLWRNIALNLTVLDLFDTDPPPGVSRNEVQVRSSLGVKF